MQINFPRIVRSIDLGEYAPEMEGQTVLVWVNPPSGDLSELLENYAAAVNNELEQEQRDAAKPVYIARLSEILSQGEQDTHISVDDLNQMETQSRETEPLFWMWFMNRVMTEIGDHRLRRKKA